MHQPGSEPHAPAREAAPTQDDHHARGGDAPSHAHSPAHDHSHSHSHAHSHAADVGRAFAIGIVLNLGFVGVETIYGILGNSLALIADAGHNLSDVLGLVVAWVGTVLSRVRPSERFTYGLRDTSILAALLNALFLVAAIGAIVYAAVERLMDPQPIAGTTVMVVAGIGILVNAGTALLFASGRDRDLNIRGAYLHMAADAGVSAGVVVSGALVMLTGWLWLDPLVSLAIAVVIAWGTWGLLRESARLLLSGVPAHIDPAQVRSFLAAEPGVSDVHDLHIWAMSTTEVALTAHLVMPGGHPGDAALLALATTLKQRFGIDHPTIQVEIDGRTLCPFAPSHVV